MFTPLRRRWCSAAFDADTPRRHDDAAMIILSAVARSAFIFLMPMRYLILPPMMLLMLDDADDAGAWYAAHVWCAAPPDDDAMMHLFRYFCWCRQLLRRWWYADDAWCLITLLISDAADTMIFCCRWWCLMLDICRSFTLMRFTPPAEMPMMSAMRCCLIRWAPPAMPRCRHFRRRRAMIRLFSMRRRCADAATMPPPWCSAPLMFRCRAMRHDMRWCAAKMRDDEFFERYFRRALYSHAAAAKDAPADDAAYFFAPRYYYLMIWRYADLRLMMARRASACRTMPRFDAAADSLCLSPGRFSLMPRWCRQPIFARAWARWAPRRARRQRRDAVPRCRARARALRAADTPCERAMLPQALRWCRWHDGESFAAARRRAIADAATRYWALLLLRDVAYDAREDAVLSGVLPPLMRKMRMDACLMMPSVPWLMRFTPMRGRRDAMRMPFYDAAALFTPMILMMLTTMLCRFRTLMFILRR